MNALGSSAGHSLIQGTEDVMRTYLSPLVITVTGLLVIAGFGVAYEWHRIWAGNVVFLGTLTVTLGVVVAIVLKRMSHSDVSVEQMLFKADHATRT
jgi:hypothetical protein